MNKKLNILWILFTISAVASFITDDTIYVGEFLTTALFGIWAFGLELSQVWLERKNNQEELEELRKLVEENAREIKHNNDFLSSLKIKDALNKKRIG